MQEHGPQETVGGNSCGVFTFLVIHGYSPMDRIEQGTAQFGVIGYLLQVIRIRSSLCSKTLQSVQYVNGYHSCQT